MFRKLLVVFVSAVLLLTAVGCACMNTTTPTPSPTATLIPTTVPSPAVTDMPTLSASPGIGSEMMQGIENFMEGTEVKEDEIPEVISAVKKQHEGAKIVSIKHAMQQNMQVYAVEIEVNGKTQTVYAKPDGTLLDGSGATTGGTTGGNP